VSRKGIFFDMGQYEEILAALVDADVDFIVGGGVACVLHGVERVTMDVDVAVATDPTNFANFLSVMEKLGLKPRVPVDPRSLLDQSVLDHIIHEKQALVFSFLDPDVPTRQVDMFLRSDLNHQAMTQHVETVEFRGKSLKLVSKQKLLEIKLAIDPPRVKDQIDIEFLRKNV
jgi:hypothetical protein